MNRAQIEKVIADIEAANHSSEGPLMSRSIPTNTAILWATLEVARQLMIANELAMPNAKCEAPRAALAKAVEA
jgi:hypothetical protein